VGIMSWAGRRVDEMPATRLSAARGSHPCQVIRAKESDLPGFLQGTWVEFHRSLDDEEALHRLACGIQGIPPGRQPGVSIPEGECPYLGLKL
jgi:hypothetical protein